MTPDELRTAADPQAYFVDDAERNKVILAAADAWEAQDIAWKRIVLDLRKRLEAAERDRRNLVMLVRLARAFRGYPLIGPLFEPWAGHLAALTGEEKP